MTGWQWTLTLPFGLLRLLKPCKVKRFLATEDLSVVGLVTGSSGHNGLKWKAGGKRKGVLRSWKNVGQKRERDRKRNHEGDEEGHRNFFQSERTYTLSVCASGCNTHQALTFVFGWRRGVGFRGRARLGLLLLLFLLAFLTTATKGTGGREGGANITNKIKRHLICGWRRFMRL